MPMVATVMDARAANIWPVGNDSSMQAIKPKAARSVSIKATSDQAFTPYIPRSTLRRLCYSVFCQGLLTNIRPEFSQTFLTKRRFMLYIEDGVQRRERKTRQREVALIQKPRITSFVWQLLFTYICH
jgi:hypothetical protein